MFEGEFVSGQTQISAAWIYAVFLRDQENSDANPEIQGAAAFLDEDDPRKSDPDPTGLGMEANV